MSKLKATTIYLDSESKAFLEYKVSLGFKVSSYIRFLLSEAHKKEQGGEKR